MKKRKKQNGSVIIAALGILLLLAIIGWGLISTSTFLIAESGTKTMTTQAYFLADAGIQRATEKIFNDFKGLGLSPTVLTQLRGRAEDYMTDPSDLFGGSGYPGYPGNPYDMEVGKYEVEVIKVVDQDVSSLTVRLRSTGTTLKKNLGLTHPVQMCIEADVKYFLAGTELADFAYFANNYGYMDDGVKIAGSVASNGYFNYSGNINITGGDRYRHCSVDSSGNYTLESKIDDGGLFAGKQIQSSLGSTINGLNGTGIGDVLPAVPVEQDQDEGRKTIPMPSLAQLDFYKDGALKAEKNHKDAIPPEKHGIYSYIPAGTKIYATNGTTVLHTVVTNDTDAKCSGNYIKVCDAVVGDGNSTYAATDPNNEYKVFEAFRDPNGALGYKISSDTKKNVVISNVGMDPNAMNGDPNGLYADPNHPIKIYGEVIVEGNVVIQGTVQGVGSIYSGKNIYVPDGIVYAKPPGGITTPDFRGFVDTADGDSSGEPNATALENAKHAQQNWLHDNQPGSADDPNYTDMLGLFATENILLGNPAVPPCDTSGASDSLSPSGVAYSVWDQPGTIRILDSNTSEAVNFNDMDEAKLGNDGVTATRVNTTGEEYTLETNSQWDVKFYSNTNLNPGGKNPYLNDIGAADANMANLTDTEVANISSILSTPYNSWPDKYKRAVVPGSGEDLDGDGGYDGSMDLFDAVSFSSTIASATRSSYSNNVSNARSNNSTAWVSAFNMTSADWGGNIPFYGNIDNLGDICGKCFTGRNFAGQPWYERYAAQLDAIIYTNHVIAGAVQGNSNGSLATRVEAYGMFGIKQHDDRVVGGGESLSSTGCQIPLVPRLETVRWKEYRK